jgi:hypothetical protein
MYNAHLQYKNINYIILNGGGIKDDLILKQ